MKNKAPLALMEQLIMVLVFALAAALCLQVFVYAGNTSRTMEARDQAVTLVQNAAEITKLCKGDLSAAAQKLGGTVSGETWQLPYDEHWQLTAGQAAYMITVEPEPAEYTWLCRKRITAADAAGEDLFSITVCWQEVPHA